MWSYYPQPNNNHYNEILIKHDPLVYIRAGHAVQKNKKKHLD